MRPLPSTRRTLTRRNSRRRQIPPSSECHLPDPAQCSRSPKVKLPENPPKRKKGVGSEAAAPTNNTQRANLLLEAITMRDEIEREQNDILRSLETMSARVTKVLPDGNMMVKGQKVDYRQRNQVRYITTITGILRPADVDDSNIVSATKLANPNVKIKRQQSGAFVRERLERLAPLIGQQRAGLMGRIGDFAQQ